MGKQVQCYIGSHVQAQVPVEAGGGSIRAAHERLAEQWRRAEVLAAGVAQFLQLA